MADPFFDAFLSDPATREAREWLDSSDGNTLGELQSTEESRVVIENAYTSGAVRVLAVDIDEYEDQAANTGKLVLELPTNPDDRTKLFAWAANIAESRGFDAVIDRGQNYLFVSLD